MKPAPSDNRALRYRHMESAILFAVGPYKFAIAATEVDEIRDMHGLKPASLINAPAAVRKIKYLLHRDRRTCQVVDASFHFHMLPSKPARILVLRGGHTALTADSIDRMTDLEAVVSLPRAFEGEERNWFRGLALVENIVVPIVNTAAVLTDAEGEIARTALAAEGVHA